LADEPLLLAIYYKPDREPQDIFLFEVIENFGDGAIDSDQELFEVTFGASSGLSLEPGQLLHLVLTNPSEFEKAARANWSLMEELRQAIAAGNFRVLYSHPDYLSLRGTIHA
jgi:hypothetical protein